MKIRYLFIFHCILLIGWLLPQVVFGGYQHPELSTSYSPDSPATSSNNVNPAAKTVYFISGLAADERLFKNLQLPANIKAKHIIWFEPERKEAMQDYCRRLAVQIDTSEAFSLVGVSFGGMVAVEMNKFLHPQKTILISSIVTSQGLSRFFKVVDKLNLHKAMPTWVYKHFYQGAYWFFNPQTNEQRALIIALMDNAPKNLLRWSVDQLISWQNSFEPANTFVIAGSKDRVFPHNLMKPYQTVEGGTHMMVYNKGPEISKILDVLLGTASKTNMATVIK